MFILCHLKMSGDPVSILRRNIISVTSGDDGGAVFKMVDRSEIRVKEKYEDLLLGDRQV